MSTSISNLTNYTAPLSSDVMPIDDLANNETKKVTRDSLGVVFANYTKIVGPANGKYADYYTDGTADEVQINAAITAVNAAGGGVVYVRAGTYNCAANISMASDVHFKGEGWKTIFVLPGATHRISCRDINNFRISSIQVDTTTKTSGDAQEKGIIVWGCTNWEVDHCYLPSYGFGLFVCSSDVVCERGWIHHNYMKGTRRNDVLGGGILSDTAVDTRNVIISDNHIVKENATAENNYNAFDWTGVKGVIFVNNYLQGNLLLGYERDPNYKIVVANNIVNPASGTTTVRATLYIQDTSNSGDVSSNVLVSGNVVNGGCIWVEGQSSQRSTNMQIVGNHIINSSTYTEDQILDIPSCGIKIQNTNRALVSSNFIDGGGVTDGIICEDTNKVHVIGNFIYNTGTGLTDAGTVSGNNWSNNYTDTVTTATALDGGSTSNNNIDV